MSKMKTIKELAARGWQAGEHRVYCSICSSHLYWSRDEVVDVCDKHAIEPMDERWDDCK